MRSKLVFWDEKFAYIEQVMLSRAKAVAFGVPRVATPEEIIEDTGIDAILNLMIPKGGYDTCHSNRSRK